MRSSFYRTFRFFIFSPVRVIFFSVFVIIFLFSFFFFVFPIQQNCKINADMDIISLLSLLVVGIYSFIVPKRRRTLYDGKAQCQKMCRRQTKTSSSLCYACMGQVKVQFFFSVQYFFSPSVLSLHQLNNNNDKTKYLCCGLLLPLFMFVFPA